MRCGYSTLRAKIYTNAVRQGPLIHDCVKQKENRKRKNGKNEVKLERTEEMWKKLRDCSRCNSTELGRFTFMETWRVFENWDYDFIGRNYIVLDIIHTIEIHVICDNICDNTISMSCHILHFTRSYCNSKFEMKEFSQKKECSPFLKSTGDGCWFSEGELSKAIFFTSFHRSVSSANFMSKLRYYVSREIFHLFSVKLFSLYL